MIPFTFYFHIVKGSTPAQVEVASEVINMYLWRDTMARYANFTAAIPLVKGAVLKPQYKSEAQFVPTNIQKALQPDWAYIAEKTPEWRARWDRQVKANMR
jgi:hypothetical protein